MPQFGPQTRQKEWLKVVNQAFDNLVERFPSYVQGKLPGTVPYETRQAIEGIPEFAKASEAFVRGRDVEYTPQMALRGQELAGLITGGGIKGGLPVGSVGTGITKPMALRQLTQGMLERLAKGSAKMPTKSFAKKETQNYYDENFRDWAVQQVKGLGKALSGLAETPREALRPVKKFRWQESKTFRGQYDPKPREVILSPKNISKGTVPHEVTGHAAQFEPQDVFKNLTPGRKIIAQEAQDLRRKLWEATRSGEMKRELAYDIDPVEIHASFLESLYRGRKPGSEYENVFWKSFNQAVTFSRRRIKELDPGAKGYPFD